MESITEFQWKGRLGPLDLALSDKTFAPSTISSMLAEAMVIGDGDVVIDVGCGSGILAIIAAKLGAGHVYGVDQAEDVVEVATSNAVRHGVADMTTFMRGDLFDPLPLDLKADVIIGDVSGIPDLIALESGWFPSGYGGGPSGSELPIRMLERAKQWLTPKGKLFLPTGTLQDENAILRAAKNMFSSLTQITERRIPLPAALAESAAVRKLVQDKIVQLTEKGSRALWMARVWECTT
ncbi:MAG TPA: 50S ribosomal protein L11 methyltransferase [Acidimicrobiia bacterium]|jgi:SAM-dependent methyltransferase